MIFFVVVTLVLLWIGKEIGNSGNHEDVEGLLTAKIEGFFSRSLFFSTDKPKFASCVEDGSKQPRKIWKFRKQYEY